MVVRRRRKNVRAHGHKTHFTGEGGQGQRGQGNKGGSGRAGHGKRAAHNKFKYINDKPDKGFFNPSAKKVKAINLEFLEKFDSKEVDLSALGYGKLLGKGKITKPLKVKVKSCSKKAKERIEEAGGEIIEI